MAARHPGRTDGELAAYRLGLEMGMDVHRTIQRREIHISQNGEIVLVEEITEERY